MLRPRGRLHLGPALARLHLPLGSVLLSATCHVLAFGALFYAAHLWREHQPRTYVVNLVPAVAAVGAPQGRPSLPARPEDLRPPAPTPTELPRRETSRELPTRERARDALGLPERSLPPRAAALPRAGEKELPSVASAPTKAPTRATSAARPPEPPAPPPQALGQRTGSAAGAGAVTLNVSDFPFAWYLSRVQAKITERWAGRALPGQQPVAVFDIGRDGQMSGLAISRSSGNTYYDQAALRAITEANPFPPLPPDFPGTTLRVHLGFNFATDRG